MAAALLKIKMNIEFFFEKLKGTEQKYQTWLESEILKLIKNNI